MTNGDRQTKGRGRLFDSVVETVGDTPCIRVNNLAPKNAKGASRSLLDIDLVRRAYLGM